MLGRGTSSAPGKRWPPLRRSNSSRASIRWRCETIISFCHACTPSDSLMALHVPTDCALYTEYQCCPSTWHACCVQQRIILAGPGCAMLASYGECAHTLRTACSRIICALFAGSAAGILGIEGFPGFGLYFLQHIACTLPMLAKTGFAPGKYYAVGGGYDSSYS